MFRKKRFLAIAVLDLILFVLLISVLELIGFIFATKPGGNLVGSWRYNHTWRPSSSWQHKEWKNLDPRFPEPYTHYYNKQGWLEKYDVSTEKQKKTFRIFYLGDSFIEGTVPMESSVPSSVEAHLNNLAEKSGIHFEVINTGTASYSPIIYRLLVEDIVREYAPDLLVINIDMTDDYDDWKYAQTALYDSYGNLIAVPPRNAYGGFIDFDKGTVHHNFITKLLLFLYKNSYFYNFVCQKFRRNNELDEFKKIRQDGEFYQRWAWCTENWTEQTIKNVETTLFHLTYIAKVCKEKNIRLLFSTSPHSSQFPRHKNVKPVWSPKIHYILEDFCKRIDVPFINSHRQMYDYIAGTPHEKYYYVNDMHFNPHGYELWSKIHIQFLLEPSNKVIPQELLEKICHFQKQP